MVAMDSGSCGKKLCKRVLPSTPLYCRCGVPFCSEACFVSQWHAEHRHACPNAAEIKKEVADRRSSSERSGTALLVATALSRTRLPSAATAEEVPAAASALPVDLLGMSQVDQTRPIPKPIVEPEQIAPAAPAASPATAAPSPQAPPAGLHVRDLIGDSMRAHFDQDGPPAEPVTDATMASVTMHVPRAWTAAPTALPQPSTPAAASGEGAPALAPPPTSTATAPSPESSVAPSPVGTTESMADSASSSTTSITFGKRKSLPRYELDHFIFGGPIGNGSYGHVRKVIHKTTGELFAIKEIPKKKVREQQMTEYLMREVKTQLLIKHRNVLRLFYYFEDSQKVYLLLEYANGGSLFSHLRKKGKLKEDEAAPLFVDVVSALDYLHKRGIVHRDLKPENILMCSGDVAKIADFGWCAEVSKDGAQRNTFCGTWDYLSPEMVQNQPHDYTVDIWAAGVLLFEMLTGRPPFSASSQVKALTRITDVDLQIPEMISAMARDLIIKLLRKEPSERLALQDAEQHPWVQRYMPKIEEKKMDALAGAHLNSPSSGGFSSGANPTGSPLGSPLGSPPDSPRSKLLQESPGATATVARSPGSSTDSPDRPDGGASIVPTSRGWVCPTGQPLPKARAKAGSAFQRSKSKADAEARSDMQKSSDFMEKIMAGRLEPVGPQSSQPAMDTPSGSSGLGAATAGVSSSSTAEFVSHSPEASSVAGAGTASEPLSSGQWAVRRHLDEKRRNSDKSGISFESPLDSEVKRKADGPAEAARPRFQTSPVDGNMQAKADARAEARARLPSATAALLEALRAPKGNGPDRAPVAAAEDRETKSDTAEQKPQVPASAPPLNLPPRSPMKPDEAAVASTAASPSNAGSTPWQETDTFRNIQKWVRRSSKASVFDELEVDKTVAVSREPGLGKAGSSATTSGDGASSSDRLADAGLRSANPLRLPTAADTQRERFEFDLEPPVDKKIISPSSPINGALFSGGVFDKGPGLVKANGTSANGVTTGGEMPVGAGISGLRGAVDFDSGPLAGALVRTGSKYPNE